MLFIFTFLIWLLLIIAANITNELALFLQTTPFMKDSSIYEKLLASEFWATINWIFVIPFQKIGITFLNPLQLGMSNYVSGFLAQIISDKFWLKVPTTIDDYCAMLFILAAVICAKVRLFG
jgi:uncharacterized protein (DUF486 family)